jgi:RNA polymerase sigma-70 factor, ECF subfamily
VSCLFETCVAVPAGPADGSWAIPPRPVRAQALGEAGEASVERGIMLHLDAAYNFACWLARDAGEAEVIVQDACVLAAERAMTVRGGDWKVWLLRIVRQVASARSRGTEPSGAGKAGGGALGAAVGALPRELRECVVLRDVEALSYHEIAEITEVSIATVVLRLHGAYRALLGPAAIG